MQNLVFHWTGCSIFDRIPQLGIWGNDHIMMWDSNSDEIAGVLLKWINTHLDKKKR